METEEKAKAYDEALERAKKLYEQGTITESLSYVFPVLKESEDDRILKHLKAVVKAYDMWAERGLDMNDILAWLEKQGEQKQDPCDNCKDVTLNCHNFPCTKKRAFKQGKSVLEVINEEKVDNANKVEHNPAWSEEDERMLDEIIDFFENGTVKLQHDLSLYASWLKFIKNRVQPQNTWKPSDEQMKAFENFVRGIWESCYDSPYENKAKLLYSLLSDLKKLRKE